MSLFAGDGPVANKKNWLELCLGPGLISILSLNSIEHKENSTITLAIMAEGGNVIDCRKTWQNTLVITVETNISLKAKEIKLTIKLTIENI